jgi:hypothetical protein
VALGATHHDLVPHVLEAAREVQTRFGGSWNTYVGHGLAPAKGELYTCDHWGGTGRGYPLAEATGDAMCAWILGQHQIRPVLILIWWSWVWYPNVGWRPYSGFQGNHGPGPDAHIHVGYE